MSDAFVHCKKNSAGVPIAKCPVCRKDVVESGIVKIWLKGMEGGELLLICEKIERKHWTQRQPQPRS